jgi:hypothetical protein
LFARPGAIPGGGLDMSTSPAYQRENAAMALVSRISAVAFSVKDGSDWSHIVEGYHNSWKAIGGPPLSELSRDSCAITADMVPPAESPATAIRVESAPISEPCSATHRVAAQASSTAAG